MNSSGFFDDYGAGSDADLDFIAETHRRRLVVLLADTSGSMGQPQDGIGRPIDALNRHLETWLPRVRAEGLGALRDVEFAVVTFGAGGVRVVSGSGEPSEEDGGAFVPAAQLDVGPFAAGGATPLTEALDLALELAEQRRRHVQEVHHQQAGRPRLILFSDGAPTDMEGNPSDGWRQLAGRLATWRAAGRLQLYAFGMPGADDEVMRALAAADGYFRLAEMDFKTLLDLILVASSEYTFDPARAAMGLDAEP